MKTNALVGAFVSGALLSACRRPVPPAAARDAISRTVDAFHEALAKGDRGAATALLADDAQVLENGERQNRAQYLEQHLAADIGFAKSVATVRSATIVRQEGDVAWTTSMHHSVGQFMSRDVNTDATELMVLSNTPDGWRIRAIHWSVQPHRQ